MCPLFYFVSIAYCITFKKYSLILLSKTENKTHNIYLWENMFLICIFLFVLNLFGNMRYMYMCLVRMWFDVRTFAKRNWLLLSPAMQKKTHTHTNKTGKQMAGCGFLTYFATNPESAATAQSVLHEKQTLPGVSKHVLDNKVYIILFFTIMIIL